MSKSVPFLTAPNYPKGMTGDEQFDPMGFSNDFDINWLREAELKHCRVGMLACLGYVVQQYVTLPGLTPVADSNLAPAEVGWFPMATLVAWAGVYEWTSNKGKMTMMDMHEDGREPGALGFDPLMRKGGAGSERMELRELKNGEQREKRVERPSLGMRDLH